MQILIHDTIIHFKLCFLSIATPCSVDGIYFRNETKPPPPQDRRASDSDNIWHPFEDRLAFAFTHHHYVELQSSERGIAHGLDLWLAATLKEGGTDIPWQKPKEIYEAIDNIEAGITPWSTYTFSYNGPKPAIPPRWMEETYELNVRDLLMLAEAQIANPDFENQFEYTPYREFDPNGDRIWSNFMSGEWANDEAVSSDSKSQDLVC